MSGRICPPHIRTLDDALDFLPIWAESFAGTLRDGIAAVDRPTATGEVVLVDIDEFHIDFPHAGTVLSVAMVLDTDLNATSYKFDLRRSDGTLLWREDNHPGHEHEHAGPHHLHIGPGENHRVTSGPRSLVDIADKVVTTHINRI